MKGTTFYRRMILFVFPVLFMLVAVFVFSQTERRVQQSVSCRPADLTGLIRPDELAAVFEGENINVPQLALKNDYSIAVLGATDEEKWIEIDLSEQKLRAWQGNSLYMETAVSTGLSRTPTPTGEFRIWIKLRATKMEGGVGKGYYYLPNVPYVMFFENEKIPGRIGYGIHGAYWHNDFGRQRSHGCVNLPIPAAQQLYNWTTPVIPAGKYVAKSTPENPGTRIVIHE